MAESYKARAIVTRGSLHDKAWKLEDVTTTADVQDDEVVVEMVASGICHTDILFGTLPPDTPLTQYPRIMGHEGSGYIRYVGKNVSSVSVGDPVLLSYTFCRSCHSCKDSHLSYCEQFVPLNFGGRPTFRDSSGADIAGSFFGQSSFASFSVARESSLVNAKDLVSSREELALFAPLGCGIQTGCGTVVNASGATRDSVVVVTGLGGVGLSAVMAAGMIVGARTVVGVDRVRSRLDLARRLGATHVVDASALPHGKSLSDVVRELCDGHGPHVTVESTGVPHVIEAAVDFTRAKGQILQVGAAPPGWKLEIDTFTFLTTGKTYRGVIEGESNPPEFVPRMVKWYREGKFPIDKLVKFIKAEEFEQGLHEMHTGETIKPVMLW